MTYFVGSNARRVPRRVFGSEGETLPILGLGCSRIGSLGNLSGTRECARLLDAALAEGVSLFDTADNYGQGDSERAIGRLLRGRRESGFVVTKVGKTFSTRFRLMRPFKPLLRPILAVSATARNAIVARREQAMSRNFEANYVRSAIEASLRRLAFEYVDAVLLHGPSAFDLADPALHESLIASQKAGRVRHWGVSCDDVECLRAAVRMPGISLVEIAPELLDEASRLAKEQPTRVGILLREVAKNRGNLGVVEAMMMALRHPAVTCAIVRTGSIPHLKELVFGALSLDPAFSASLMGSAPNRHEAPKRPGSSCFSGSHDARRQ